MTPWRRRLRRARLAFTFCIAALIIAAAMLAGVAQLLLPQIALHPDRVAAFLSERLHRPVSIDGVNGRWEGTGAVLRLDGVHIAANDPSQPPLVVPEAELALDFSAWLRTNRRWSEFRLAGLDITVRREPDGRWNIAGISAGDAGSTTDDNPLLMLGALVVRDSRVRLIDDTGPIDVVLRADELRLLNWGTRHRLLGQVRRDADNASPVQLVVEHDGANGDGRGYVGGKALDLAMLLQGLTWRGHALASAHGRAQAWAQWKAMTPTSGHVALQLTDVAVFDPSAPVDAARPPPRLAALQGVARWRADATGWRLDVADLRAGQDAVPEQPSAFDVTYRRGADAARGDYVAQANFVDVATLGALATQLPMSERARRWFADARPGGRVRDLSARFAGRDDFDVTAVLDGLRCDPADGKPGVDGLSARIDGDGGAIVLHVPAQSTALRFPNRFRQPFVLSHFAGDIAAFRADEGWRLQADPLQIEGAGFAIDVAGGAMIPDDGSRPALDVYANVLRADTTTAKLFLPTSMSPKTIAWLDHSLVEGNVAGRGFIHGDLDDWPFANRSGRFHARANLSQLVLDYREGWPAARDMTLVADFVNNGMHADVDSANVMDVHVGHAVGEIRDFDDARLDLVAEASGTGPHLLALLNASPIGRAHADELKGVSIGGSGAVDLELSLPLKLADHDTRIRGEVALANADLADSKYAIRFGKANGVVTFGEGGLLAGPLEVQHAGRPATFTLAIGDTVKNRRHQVEALLHGNLPIDAVLGEFDTLAPLWPHFRGSSDWDVRLDVPASTGATNASPPATIAATSDTTSAATSGVVSTAPSEPVALRISSELRGIAIDLPAPFNKPDGDAMPLDLRLTLPLSASAVELDVGDLMHLRARLPDATRPFAAAVSLGIVVPEQLPDAGVTISGHAREIDLSGWSTLGFGGGAGMLRSVDLRIDTAHLFGRTFDNIGLKVQSDVERIAIDLAGPDVQGNVQIPTTELAQRGITAQLERLHWPETPPGESTTDTSTALGEVTPAQIPPLHVWVGDFKLGAASFGEARLETLPTATGMRIDQFETKSGDLQMDARGEWTGAGKQTRSQFSIDISAEDLGRMLGALGFTGLFEGGQSLLQIRAGWAGPPTAFALERLDGTLAVSVGEGRVLDVEPGMGRIFGLFSVREIPRRLALDFGDLFQTGMSFNAITGEFVLKESSAFTRNLQIKSPAADIRITGRTGLKAKDYDQQMVVTPHVGGTLPVVGALAAGPAGAAAGLAVQTLFSKAINRATMARYHVTGSWDKPVITLTAREGGRRARDAGPTPERKPRG